jgi:hypothetical protein
VSWKAFQVKGSISIHSCNKKVCEDFPCDCSNREMAGIQSVPSGRSWSEENGKYCR